ncbi:hypothetical protein ACJX0J_034138, partial [Zea mays]
FLMLTLFCFVHVVLHQCFSHMHHFGIGQHYFKKNFITKKWDSRSICLSDYYLNKGFNGQHDVF